MLIFLSFYLNTKLTTDKILFIPQGSINSIVTHLSKEGYDVTWLDSFILRIFGAPQKGWINIGKESLTKGEFLYLLTIAKAATKDVIFIPGDTTYVILKKIAQEFNLDFKNLEKIYNKQAILPDGVIAAQTYKLPITFNEAEILKYIIDFSMSYHKNLAIETVGKYDEKEWFRIITIASIIQKEAANANEMPLVSSVIHNRLKKNMKLQMDGTLNYGKYSNEKITSRRIKEDNSAFNTYKFKSLPPYPVSIVNKEAILAAIFPTKSNFLYFVKNTNKEHTFSETYKAHIKAIKNGNK